VCLDPSRRRSRGARRRHRSAPDSWNGPADRVRGPSGKARTARSAGLGRVRASDGSCPTRRLPLRLTARRDRASSAARRPARAVERGRL